MNQTTIFDECNTLGTNPKKLARRNDPLTSHAAARSVNTAKWEGRVLEAIKWHGNRGAIQDEILAWISDNYGPAPYSTVTARFKALEEKGLIKYTDQTRKGISGRMSRVRIAC